MNCNKCGCPLNANQDFCPNCGSSVNNNSAMNNNFNTNNNFNSFDTMQNNNAMNNNYNNGNFNNNFDNNLNNNFDNNNLNNNNNFNNQNMFNNNNNNFGNTNFGEPNPNGKKSIWIYVGVGIFAIMIIGMIFVGIFGKVLYKKYSDDKFTIKYNSYWEVTTSNEKTVLVYKDKTSKVMVQNETTFESLKYQILSDYDLKVLYNAFYEKWGKLDDCEMLGGSETFIPLDNEEGYYANFDYKTKSTGNLGAFYVVISEDYNSMIYFVTLVGGDKQENATRDIKKMISSIEFNGSKVDKPVNPEYVQFSAGDAVEYTFGNTMSYKVPSCWKISEERTKNANYTSHIFTYKDNVSLLSIKSTVLNNINDFDTAYGTIKESIIRSHKAIAREDSLVVNDRKWNYIVTPKFVSGDNEYSRTLYFTFSNDYKYVYYVDLYESADNTKDKYKYTRDGIKYIMESVRVFK